MSKLKYYDGTDWKIVNGQVTGDTLPIGAIVPFGGWDAPTGWLICDGTLLNKTDYPELFNAIGYSFGGEEGGSTFGLPDLRGRVPVGEKDNDSDFDGIGVTGGSKYLQAHSHTIVASTILANPGSGGTGTYIGTGTTNTSVVGTGNSGNLQPYQTVNYIIKAKQSAGVVANVSKTYSTSETDTYSCNYMNNRITGTELWTNTSLGAAFGPQTIQVDLSPYKYVELVYYRYPSTTTPMFRIFTKVGDISQLNYCDYDSGSVRAWIREFEVKSTGIEFKIATINGTTDNGGLVPGKIIGHK